MHGCVDVETHRGPCGVLFLLSTEYSVVMCMARNLNDLTMALSPYDILLCSETLVSDMSRVGVAGSLIQSPCLVPWQDASGLRDVCIRTRWLRSICEGLCFETELLCVQSLPQH